MKTILHQDCCTEIYHSKNETIIILLMSDADRIFAKLEFGYFYSEKIRTLAPQIKIVYAKAQSCNGDDSWHDAARELTSDETDKLVETIQKKLIYIVSVQHPNPSMGNGIVTSIKN